MYLDVVDLRNFYAQPLGIMTRRLLGRAVRSRFDNVSGLRVLGLGYATPYLGAFREEAERCIAVMPAAQGVVRWPSAGAALATLADETMLPLPTASMDRVIAVHALEMTADAGAMLQEVWRVLAPGGLFAFTVETHKGEDVILGEGLRYAHAAAWLRQRLAQAGLDVLSLAEVSTRDESGAPVPGLVAVAQSRAI